MTTIYVQFSDATNTQIINVFGVPQDPAIYPNQGIIESSNPIWKAYYDAEPSFMQAALPTPD